MDYEKEFGKSVKERGFDQDLQSITPKRMVAYQIEREMARQKVSRVEMAKRMNTSRASLNRLLDSENRSVTLQTIETAAEVLNLNIVINFEKKEAPHEQL